MTCGRYHAICGIIMIAVVCLCCFVIMLVRNTVGGSVFFFQAEDGIRDLVRSRGLGDVYKRQEY